MQQLEAGGAAAAWPPGAIAALGEDASRGYLDAPPSVLDLLEGHGAAGGRVALIGEAGATLTYGELAERARRLAGGLQRRYEVEPGEPIGLLFANSLDFCVAYFGVLASGAVAVPLNTKLAGSELAVRVADAGARVLLASPEWWPKLRAHRGRTSLVHVALGGGGDEDRLEDLVADPLREPAGRGDDPAMVVYTSGTTGVPKGALLSHANVVQAALTYARCLELDADDTTVVAVPLFHVTGLNGQLLPILAVGGSARILGRFHAEQAAALLADREASFFHAAPSVYQLLLAAAGGKRARGLRLALCGGGAISPATIDQVLEYAPGVDFRTVYGLTETSSPATLLPAGQLVAKPTSSGIAVPVDRVRIAGDEEVGEILVAGATVSAGYLREEGDAESHRAGMLRTGDIGRLDADGFLYVLDRLKDVINRGGEKVASLGVERVLYGHGAVAECAVVGRPDSLYGEVPVAFVVARESVRADELRRFAAEHLAKYEVPAAIEFLDELPHNAAGKVAKDLLRARCRLGAR